MSPGGSTSLDAQALVMGITGSLAPDMSTDVIAVDGDPLKNIMAMRRVVFGPLSHFDVTPNHSTLPMRA